MRLVRRCIMQAFACAHQRAKESQSDSLILSHTLRGPGLSMTSLFSAPEMVYFEMYANRFRYFFRQQNKQGREFHDQLFN